MAKEKLEKEVGAPEIADPGVDAAVPAESETATPDAVSANPSARDRARNWMKSKNPDLNMDDEDAYYGAVNDTFGKYDKMENNVKNLQGAIDKNSMFGQMIATAAQDPEFNPAAWLRENIGIDITEAIADDEFATKLAEATNKWTANQAEEKETIAQVEKNAPKAFDQIQKFAEEKGQTPEEIQDNITKMFDFVDEFIGGNYFDLYKMMSLAKGYDADIENAREEGEAAGRHTKVTDKIKEFPREPESNTGTQAPVSEPKPVQRRRNMFQA